jgi:cation diffusion facilitator family transporter
MTKKERVALGSLIASLSLTVVKLAVGLLIGSLAMVTDALHSGTDAIATLVTYLAVRFADKPADDDHPYGHGKFEDVAALGEATLLLLLAGGVAVEAWRRFGEGTVPPDVGVLAFAVMIVEIGINLWRAFLLHRTARETGSRALAADALHFASDVASGLLVIIGFVLTLAGVPGADPITAAAVALFIAILGLRMIRRTFHELTDRVPPGQIRGLTRLIEGLPGVVGVDRVRLRSVGQQSFVEVAASVPRTFSVEQLTAVKEEITATIAAELGDAEVSSSCRPVVVDDETLRDRVLLAASRVHTPVHHVTIQHLGDRLSVSLDFEVEGEMPLGEAHEAATGLEAAIRAEIGDDVEVETHIEPLLPDLVPGDDVGDAAATAVSTALRTAAAEHGVDDVHNVRVRELGDGLFVAFHCRFAAELELAEVHRRSDAVERATRAQFPAIRRIVSHSEPIGSA